MFGQTFIANKCNPYAASTQMEKAELPNWSLMETYGSLLLVHYFTSAIFFMLRFFRLVSSAVGILVQFHVDIKEDG